MCLLGLDATQNYVLQSMILGHGTSGGSLSSFNPLLPHFAMRLGLGPSPSLGDASTCRLDWGVAVAAATAYSSVASIPGPVSGAFASNADLVIDAIAFYGTSFSTCPTPIRH